MALYDLRNRTTKFGQVRNWVGQDGKKYSDTHKGDDYAETHGHDAVYAIEPGVVVKREYSSTYGHMLWVRRKDGVVVRYHMLNSPSSLNVGDQVVEGVTLIGFTGASAANATGNHVHVQVEVNGKPVDPRPYIDSSAVVDNIKPGGSTASTGAKPIEEDDMFSEEDRQRMVNIESMLARDTDPETGIKGGLRGLIRDIRSNAYLGASRAKNLEAIVATDDGGGLRAILRRIAKKIGA